MDFVVSIDHQRLVQPEPFNAFTEERDLLRWVFLGVPWIWDQPLDRHHLNPLRLDALIRTLLIRTTGSSVLRLANWNDFRLRTASEATTRDRHLSLRHWLSSGTHGPGDSRLNRLPHCRPSLV